MGKVVKGVNFVGLKEVGDPIELAENMIYNADADEQEEIKVLNIKKIKEQNKIPVYDE